MEGTTRYRYRDGKRAALGDVAVIWDGLQLKLGRLEWSGDLCGLAYRITHSWHSGRWVSAAGFGATEYRMLHGLLRHRWSRTLKGCELYALDGAAIARYAAEVAV